MACTQDTEGTLTATAGPVADHETLATLAIQLHPHAFSSAIHYLYQYTTSGIAHALDAEDFHTYLLSLKVRSLNERHSCAAYVESIPLGVCAGRLVRATDHADRRNRR